MMKYYFYFYSIVSGIALGVHLVINWRQLTGRQDARPYAWAPDFRRFLVFLSLFFVSDILWGVLAELRLSRLLYADTVFYFLAMALSVCAWTRYVVAYLEMGGRLRACMMWMGYGLLAVFVAVLVANGFTGCCFYVNAQGEYATAPLRHLMLIMLVVFNALSSWTTLAKLLHSRGAIRRRNKMVFAFGITMMAAIVLQFANPFLPLYALGCLFGCCLLHVFVVEDERDEMHRKETLAREYKAKLDAEHEVNQARSLFFSTVSHDIRTPLNAIIGFSELLDRGAGDEEERARYVSAIHSCGKTLARLVDDILDLSKMERGKLEIDREPTDVPALVREVVTAFEIVRARKSLILKTELGDMPRVSVDPHRIRQILFNLLSNAYKYTERGTVTVRAAWSGGTLALSVADTGRGIPRENVARIFQPFVQIADRNHRDGTGLGLTICQKLAALMGGELTVESEVGAGSTFTVTLRGVEECASAAPETGAGRVSAGTAGAVAATPPLPRRVLVVDDSPINCDVLESLLLKSGVASVKAVGNGREALEALKGDASGFDMVFTDLWMPEMDGNELVGAIRADAKLSRLPVYLLTADVEARSQAESNGFSGVLVKPVTLEGLKSLFRVFVAAFLAVAGVTTLRAEDGIADRLSLRASADVETAYICRGFVWDTRPFSVQDASFGVDLDPVGIVEATVWTYSPMSSSGQSAELSRYAYAEADYILRYYYDIDIAEGWRLRNGVGKQWVTNPGFRGGRSVIDWQALQVLNNPYLTPYWRLRVIRRPFEETYWVLGLKRSFDILDDLAFTVDLFVDVGDRRHMYNLYGGWADATGSRLHWGLHALSLVLRLDYRLFEHVGLFAFVGQFCVVGSDARDAVKWIDAPEARRDLTFGGAGVSVSF